jgi:hypothetical protein
LSIRSGTDFITNSWLKINKDATRYVFAGTSLREKGVERIITTSDGLVRRHLAIRLDAVLEAVKLPTSLL